MNTQETFQERMNAEMRKWEAEFDQLQAKADIAKADAKLKYAEQIDASVILPALPGVSRRMSRVAAYVLASEKSLMMSNDEKGVISF
jgi:hypothetical protein